MKRNIYRQIGLSLLLIVAGCFGAQAQQTLFDATIDRADILIGEQATVRLSLTVDPGRSVAIPIPVDTLMTGVEVIAIPKADTVAIDNGRLLIKQEVVITSFDSSLYLLPPFVAIDGADTLYSEQLALKVSTVDVDTDHPDEFFDIKEVWEPPFVWADYYPLIGGILLALLLIAAAVWLIRRLKNRKPILPPRKEAPPMPPHEEALQQLDRIKQQKLWQQGLNKAYYTEITDTLRHYIYRRYGINAQEMTSHEIMHSIRCEEIAQPTTDTLNRVLELADYVKFAKYRPLPDENDSSLAGAYRFVNETVRIETPPPVTNQDENNRMAVVEPKSTEE